MSNECFPLSAIKSMYMQLLHCFLCKHHCQAVILINEAFPLAFLSVKCTRYRTQSISTVKRVFLVYLIVTKCLINVSVSEKLLLNIISPLQECQLKCILLLIIDEQKMCLHFKMNSDL